MQAVIFDLDQTLIDRSLAVKRFSEVLWQEFLAETGGSFSTFLSQVQALDGNGYVPREDFFESMMRTFPQKFPSRKIVEGLFHIQLRNTPPLADGVVEVLSKLQKMNIALGIVTNGSAEAQQAKISNSGLDSFIDAVIISESLGTNKPAPSIYEAVISRLQIDPNHSWFVGDHPVNDIWGSKQLGFSTAWIHLNDQWPPDVERCYDVAGETFSETMTKVLGSI